MGHRHRWYSFQLAHNIHKMTSLAGARNHWHSKLLKFELLTDIDCGLHLVHSNKRKPPEESRESLWRCEDRGLAGAITSRVKSKNSTILGRGFPKKLPSWLMWKLVHWKISSPATKSRSNRNLLISIGEKAPSLNNSMELRPFQFYQNTFRRNLKGCGWSVYSIVRSVSDINSFTHLIQLYGCGLSSFL